MLRKSIILDDYFQPFGVSMRSLKKMIFYFFLNRAFSTHRKSGGSLCICRTSLIAVHFDSM